MLLAPAIKINFKESRPDSNIEVKVKVDGGFKETQKFSRGADLTWEKDMCVVKPISHIEYA